MSIPSNVKRLVAVCLLVAVPALYGCPALLVVYLISATDGDNVTVTAEIPRNADEIYNTAIKLTEEDGGRTYTVIEADPERKFLRVEALDQTWWFEMTLVQLNGRSAQLIMIGVSPGDEEEQRNRGLVAVERICTDLGVRYKVVENNQPQG
ncbi:hypothetical protein DND132_3216 [Pseudodesulfovibrio mercurii]|uniref:Uncharacterized protein n=1 Tax=Pseudodesulfovibrio mercurii TaxID=641491 RepID=F0JKH0_9BACT|nr:hypothetical protein [Pseudodesulfovibrio mercurii]EGB16419.1 hypothetical protein DND132_3216 [Pseudodesulfovibrio mercurii]